MLYIRRFVWFIARYLIVICVLVGMLACGFYMAMNISNIYVVLQDGMQKRVDVMLTRQQAEELNKYFAAEFLLADPALQGALNGQSAYVDYNITGFDYELEIEKAWAWPWDSYANCTVVERVPNITGNVIASRRSEIDSRIPKWVGGRYDITLAKLAGQWKIVGMQQVTVLMEADDITEDLPEEILVP
ncbi:MAG: hypothetical protein IJ646_01020 [Clostridia bacterium]|nr:hypothetical protein [Clostridia bacterium]